MFADWFCGNIRIFFRVHSVIIIRILRNAFRLFGNKRGDDRGQIINRKGSTKLWKDRLKPYNLTFKELLGSVSGCGSDLATSKREPMSISLLHRPRTSQNHAGQRTGQGWASHLDLCCFQWSNGLGLGVIKTSSPLDSMVLDPLDLVLPCDPDYSSAQPDKADACLRSNPLNVL